MVKAQAIASDQAVRALVAATAQRHLQAGNVLAITGMAAAVVGCVAWSVSVRRKEAGTAVLPICLIAAYVMLSLLMV